MKYREVAHSVATVTEGLIDMIRHIAKTALGAALLFVLLAVACSSSQTAPSLNLNGIPQNGLTLGSSGPEIKLYENILCETCANFSQHILPKLVNDYVKTGKFQITFVHAPVGTIPEAVYAHEAAQCAADQNKFWQYLEVLYSRGSNFTKDQLKSLATEAGLDHATFDPCLDGEQHKADVQAALQQFQSLASKNLELPVIETGSVILAGSTNYADLQYMLDHLPQ
jgi:protein-disulfide isomerase